MTRSSWRRAGLAFKALTATSISRFVAAKCLGVAGVIGSGREELTRTLFGFLPQTSGALRDRRHAGELRTRRRRPSRAASATSRASGGLRGW